MTRRLRIPFTAPFSPPIIFPSSANTLSGAIDAITAFLSAPPSPLLRGTDVGLNAQTVLLTGAGISVASGLSDYRGENGTYRRNASYRPIYFHEFVTIHEARKRYWARSFVGYPTLRDSGPNSTHFCIAELGRKGYISSVITQNVDSFHNVAHPDLPVLELHGYLRSIVCVNCRHMMSRESFQESLLRLNPAWSEFLARVMESGALKTDVSEEQRQKGLRVNPDGDVEIPGAHYSDFRYPPCPRAGILKPAVVMFGESVDEATKTAAEEAIDEAGKLLVMGSSLATFSAWRLVERAQNRGMSIGILNVGGVRNEASLFKEGNEHFWPMARLRCSEKTELVLPEVVSRLEQLGFR
uniref:NAD-dependent deacetylase sirtuin-4 n=1 Tax=Coccidioides posadasii RMSCC 3488 TaxID=454284 RepID=A0A0J6FB25_COCPO|nr:NAD-dependent deacetylase sirtuin-4 [Coccidioides posadasii RMSCC 3488]